jgi:hypothetical protein
MNKMSATKGDVSPWASFNKKQHRYLSNFAISKAAAISLKYSFLFSLVRAQRDKT